LLRVTVFGYRIFEFTPYIKSRFNTALKILKKIDYDIVCLQEVYSRLHAQKIVEELKETYPYNVFYHAEKKWKWSSGLIILSKHPIPYSDFHKFQKSTIDEGLFVDKGFLEAEIAVNDYKIHLINTHTTAGGYFYHPEHKHTDQIREQQIHQMIRRSHERACDASIITGDINAGPKVSKTNFEIFKFYQYRDVFDFSTNLVTWEVENPLNKISFHASSPSQRIDHILYKPFGHTKIKHEHSKILFKEATVKIGKKKKKSTTVSDHYAVASDLLLSSS
jgi:endonuclease/exonuclease/phosphatase family metal-dependent hydrolase